MNQLTDSNDELFERPREREITLGATLILGIFFGLAVLCAAFFGFGYSLGSKHAALPTPAVPSGVSVTAAKPAAGSATGAAAKQIAAQSVTIPVTEAPTASQPVRAEGVQANPIDKPFVETASSLSPDPSSKPAPRPTPASASAPPSASAATELPTVVQVAALSRQDDADLIASTLKRRGYAVVIRQEPQDKLLHVQVGPFATRKEAEAMRQRLLADGFNAYVK